MGKKKVFVLITMKSTTTTKSNKTPKTKKKTKKQIIIEKVKTLLEDYESLDMHVSLRQLYYRLVADGTLENKQSQYKRLSAIIVEARKAGQISNDLFEDRTRTYKAPSETYISVKEQLQYALEDIENLARYYSLPRSLYQQDVVIIALEKQALESVFAPVCDELGAYLIVGKGYNSYTQLYQFARRLKREKRRLHLKFFSDFDPSGVDIQRNFREQLKQLDVEIESFERVALTKELIEKYSLPYAPTKKSDSRSKTWAEAGVVELDALEPRVLKKLIEESILKHFNEDTYREVQKLEQIEKRRLQKKVDKIMSLFKRI